MGRGRKSRQPSEQTDHRSKSRETIAGALITAIALIIVGIIGYLATTTSASIPIHATETAEAHLNTPSRTPGLTGPSPSNESASPTNPVLTPTELPPAPGTLLTNTVPAEPNVGGFDFEAGIDGWVTSEGAYKPDSIGASSTIVHSGSKALELTTELFGSGSPEFAANNSNDVYRHTELVIYFSDHAPQGFDQRGPYDLASRRVSCFVYLPAGLASVGSPSAYVRLMVRDAHFANQFSEAVNITKDNINQWIELDVTVGKDPANEDAGFDATKINALGVRLDTLDGSTAAYSGPVYIDDCTIK